MQPAQTRRTMLGGLIAIAVTPMMPGAAVATPETMSDAMRQELGPDARPQPGRIKITLPELAENANAVSMRIAVDSPMMAQDHVKDILVFSEKNPVPTVARFHLGPRSGQARVQTNIRLAGSQTITVVARMGDASLWMASADVIVTQGACFDGT
jgi:sulfur-oxidizing protein SoxY